MATPLYDALVAKVRDWSNRPESSTIPTSVIEDCLRYGADDIYRELRIPPLEYTRTYTVSAADNNAIIPNEVDRYTVIPIPSDMTTFISLRPLAGDGGRDSPYVFNQVTDVRTFLDPYAEQYSCVRYMWRQDQLWMSPQQEIGTQLEIYYYRRLPALNATFTVTSANWINSLPLASQPFLEADSTTDTFLWLVNALIAFDTEAEADAYILLNGGVKSSVELGGKEAPNWLRDSNERLLIWASLRHVGAYLEDDKMEAKYEKKVTEDLFKLNKEEKFRRASGGNVQMNLNANGMI